MYIPSACEIKTDVFAVLQARVPTPVHAVVFGQLAAALGFVKELFLCCKVGGWVGRMKGVGGSPRQLM